MGHDLGPRLRALRAASGRTVAAVAADAGLSVPYVANLENGRGNPTVDALARLAGALGGHLAIGLGEDEPPARADPPAALVRLSRTERFRRDVRALGAATGRDEAAVAGRLLDVLARVADLTGRDLAEADWLRLLDALLLVGLHPNGTGEPHPPLSTP
ncbi:helix-turn-helix domain-containing protein [Actinosynnema sp. NPDC059335]|uniref:helix-turn-helix domain-containing protein n=1 Tax=Actinosynnema sp. NPDC059335 TaxID=3346804 RepID=UPI003670F870